MPMYINLVFEDALSLAVMKKLLSCFGKKFKVQNEYSRGGYGYIKKNIQGFNQGAKALPFFVLADLDQYPCPTELIDQWLPVAKNQNLIFRIAVKEVEAWLLADNESISKFFGVAKSNIPKGPDFLPDPKHFIFNLLNKKSRKRKLKEEILPKKGAKIGPNYNGAMMEFVKNNWDAKRASSNSLSLRKAIAHLERF